MPLLPYLIPFGLAIAIGALVRLVAGPERSAVATGIALGVALAAGWQWVIGESWVAADDVSRIIHIALGGLLLGLLFDVRSSRPLWSTAAAVVFALVVAWVSVAGGLRAGATLDGPAALRLVLYGVVMLFLLWRLDRLRTQAPSALAIMVMLAAGLTAIAVIAGESRAAGIAGVATASLAGVMLWTWVLAVPVGFGLVFTAVGTIGGAAIALLAPGGVNLFAVLLVVVLLPFAEGTARRLPLGTPAMRPAIVPLVIMVLALLPVLLAAAVQYVAQSP